MRTKIYHQCDGKSDPIVLLLGPGQGPAFSHRPRSPASLWFWPFGLVQPVEDRCGVPCRMDVRPHNRIGPLAIPASKCLDNLAMMPHAALEFAAGEVAVGVDAQRYLEQRVGQTVQVGVS